MRRLKVLTMAILVLLMIALSVNAQNTTQAIPSTWAPGPSLGLGVSIPLSLFSSGQLTTALVFLDISAEVPLTLDISTRTDLSLYLSSSGLVSSLTSGRQSILLYLNRGWMRLYNGGGVGVFPYQTSTFGTGNPGLLLSFNYLAGLKFNTEFFSLFGELMYEVMPQPVSDDAGILYNLKVNIGGQLHFCPACIFACATLEKPQPAAPCTPPC